MPTFGSDILKTFRSFERVELPGLRVLRLEHLRELVVRHRRRRVDLVLQEQLHVERLVDDRHVTRVRVVDAVLLRAPRRARARCRSTRPRPSCRCIFAIVLIPLDFQVSSVIPDRAKTWAMETSFEPFSRVAKRFGSQSRPNSAPIARDDRLGRDARAADLDRDVEPGLVVEALLERRVVARELRLRHPLELQGDLRRRLLLRARPPRRRPTSRTPYTRARPPP